MHSMRIRVLLFDVLLVGGAVVAQPAKTPMPAVSGTPVELANMRYIEIAPGTGAAAAPGKEYTVHYTGWLRDGTKFDSSVDRNEPLKFVQGRRQVIVGWEIGFEGMKVGGKRRLFIPYQLAYGENGRGPIPPKAELIFDVELLDVKDVPQLAAAVDVLPTFADLESKVLALAKSVPEDKYSWRPSAEAPSFADVLLSIPRKNWLLLSQEPGAIEVDPAKNRVLELVGENLASIHKTLDTARPTLFNRGATLNGQPSTMRGVYTAVNAQIAETLGEAVAYARMMGVQ